MLVNFQLQLTTYGIAIKYMHHLRPMRFISKPNRILPDNEPRPNKEPIQDASSTDTMKFVGEL